MKVALLVQIVITHQMYEFLLTIQQFFKAFRPITWRPKIQKYITFTSLLCAELKIAPSKCRCNCEKSQEFESAMSGYTGDVAKYILLFKLCSHFVKINGPVQNFILVLQFEQKSSCLNACFLLCLSQLIWHPSTIYLRQVYVMHSATNGHGNNTTFVSLIYAKLKIVPAKCSGSCKKRCRNLKERCQGYIVDVGKFLVLFKLCPHFFKAEIIRFRI